MDIKPVLIYKGADSTDFSDSCILGKSVCVLHFALPPLCIHGNRCPNGSATGKVNNVKSVDYDHWKVQTSTSVACYPKRVRIHLQWDPLLFCGEDPTVRRHI